MTKWAVGLSVSVGVIYLFYYLGTFLAVRTQARTFADRWLEHIKEGKIAEAFHETIRPPRKIVGGDLRGTLELQFNAPADPMGRGLFTIFTHSDFVRLIQAAGTAAKIDFAGVKEWEYSKGGYTVQLSYRVSTDLASFPLEVSLRGAESPTGEYQGRQWYVQQEMIGVPAGDGGIHFTREGGELLSQAQSGRKFVSEWVDALSRGDSKAALARMQKPADLIHIDDSIFWCDSTLRPTVEDAVKAVFDTARSRPRNLSLRPTRIPLILSDDKQARFGYDLQMTLPREKADGKAADDTAAPLIVEARIIVAADRPVGGTATQLDGHWRITAIELVRRRSAPTGGPAPRVVVRRSWYLGSTIHTSLTRQRRIQCPSLARQACVATRNVKLEPLAQSAAREGKSA